jgi:hypothetical protein
VDSTGSQTDTGSDIIILCESCFYKIPAEPINTKLDNFPIAKELFRQDTCACDHCNRKLDVFGNYFFVKEEKRNIN